MSIVDNKRMNHLRWTGRWGIAVFAVVVLSCARTTYAETLTSNNYQFDESSIGTSGLLNSGSANFGITEATGDIGIGESSSNNYQIQADQRQTLRPYSHLQLVVQHQTLACSAPALLH